MSYEVSRTNIWKRHNWLLLYIMVEILVAGKFCRPLICTGFGNITRGIIPNLVYKQKFVFEL